MFSAKTRNPYCLALSRPRTVWLSNDVVSGTFIQEEEPRSWYSIWYAVTSAPPLSFGGFHRRVTDRLVVTGYVTGPSGASGFTTPKMEVLQAELYQDEPFAQWKICVTRDATPPSSFAYSVVGVETPGLRALQVTLRTVPFDAALLLLERHALVDIIWY